MLDRGKRFADRARIVLGLLALFYSALAWAGVKGGRPRELNPGRPGRIPPKRAA
jgi:hypothetical protein